MKKLEKNINKIEFIYISQAVLFLVLAALLFVNPVLETYVLMVALIILAIASIFFAYEWVNIENKFK
ncbi:MAG: hypothetical protein PHT91_01810 [Candidatus Nanoarchaeia archaeon]|nr:hypothetical protein [Candidatus Nanoarchaeia archaeon]MDD5054297.1 hypothetical protein [Candidatus Nanoarchaeia archaeon]MDD5499591.1 hypothetical protein [Candidatus Nanoarchaeia archaeon]